MRVGLAHTGNIYIPVKSLMDRLNIDYIIPPLNNRHTLSLGVKHSPEGLCIPFKLTLGNMIEAARQGADVMVMASGAGICRLGYYARAQEQILRDLGYQAQVVRFGVSEHKLMGFLGLLKQGANNASWFKIISAFRFGLAKLHAVDKMEKAVHSARAVELNKGSANKIYAQALKALDGADDYRSLRKVQKEYITRMENLPRSEIKPLAVGVVGEFYVLLETFSNLDVENELGKLGVEVHRSFFLSEWTRFSLFLNGLGFDDKARIHRAAMPYLKRDVGGDGWESVGEKVLYSNKYDGIVHLAPFTCMPEIVAQNIMQTTRENIPVLSVLCDEQMGKSGMLTRLEAFVDLLKRRRAKQESLLKN